MQQIGTGSSSQGIPLGTIAVAFATSSSPSPTLSNTSPSSKTSPLLGAIIGGVLGGVVVLVIMVLLLFVWNRWRGRHRYVPHDDVFGEGLTASPVATITPFMDVRAPYLGLRQSEDIQPDMAEISRDRVASRSKETGREVEEMDSDENTEDTGGDATSSKLQVHVEQQPPHRHHLNLQTDLEAAVVGEYARESGRKESAPVALDSTTFTSVGAQAARSDLDDDIEKIGDRIASHHQDSGLRAPVDLK